MADYKNAAMKNLLLLILSLISVQLSQAQAVQDFTHGIFVENQAFVSNPSQWLGKVIELRNIPYVGTKPSNVNTNRAPLNNGPVNNSQSPKESQTVFTQPTSPGGNTTLNLSNCPNLDGYSTQIFSVTPNQKVCFILTSAVAKQLPARSSKLALYVYCKPDGTFEIKRVKRIG